MPIVVEVSLRTAGKTYYFDPGNEQFHITERVVVETSRGLELGTVKIPPREVQESEIVPPLKGILRRATAADINRAALNQEREARCLEICRGLVAKLNLPMRLIDAQFTLDASHVLIHFLAENRVDFRELVRELARELHTRIELRQVGVRDEAKLIGGYGICGRQLCCSAFLSDFAPVAISMAKDQGLALNPQKISGSCGRLMCCLAFECDHYRRERADMPRLNARVNTPQGLGKVTKLNVLSHMVEVSIPDAPAPIWFNVDELSPQSAAQPCCAGKTGGGCCATKSAPAPTAESHARMTTEPASSEPPAAGEEKRSRNRRRKKPAGIAAVPQPERPPASVQDGDAVEKTGRPRRRRHGKPEGAAAPVPVPIPVAAGTAPGVDGQQAPAGRYRPRRRRRPGGGEKSGNQE